jgi:hypothetical protein
MKKSGKKHIISGNIACVTGLFFTIFLLFPGIQKLMAQDTINPFGMITPFINDGSPANFPFQYPEFIGDVNGDGFGDFAVNTGAGDERTGYPMDAIYKSAVVTDIHHPDSCMVFYNSYLKGIKDYNGDGYDDVIDLNRNIIRFGSSSGLSEDTLSIDYPFPFLSPDFTILYFAGDISNDGKSEFILGDYSDYDTVYLYSGPGNSAIITDVPDLLFDSDVTICEYYDYDKDGIKEFSVCGKNYIYNQYSVYWYNFDTLLQKLVKEKNVNINVIYEPTPSYPSCFADINGDGRPDITHNYYTSADKYSVEVNFGQDNSPYFSEPVQVPAGNLHRLLYVAGDVNNDGADDWYSLTDADSVTVYFGNENIASQGFIKEKYFTGEDQIMYPLGRYFDFILAENIPVLYYDPDSIPDLLFNFWTINDNLRFDTIGCAIICGGDSLDFTDPLVLGRKADDSYPELQYGYHTRNLGDINNDGIQDWGTLAMWDCYAEVFFGSTEFDPSPDIRILLPQVERAACYDWSSGDLNGDGWIDLAISNSSEMDVTMVPGIFNELDRVFVFYGREQWPAVLTFENADVVVEDTSYFHEFGSDIGIIGDYTGDGYDDMVIGGVRYSSTYRKAYVYLGGHVISPQPDMIISMPASGGSYTFGDPVTACGDINADGFDDFTLGDPHGAQSLVYFGGHDADDQYDAVIKNPGGPPAYTFGGFTVRNEGDYDADGYPDLVQATYYPVEGAYIYKGGPDFDTIYDYRIADTSINYQSPEMAFIKGFTNKDKSDLMISQWSEYKSYIFSEVESIDLHPDYVLKNEYGRVSGVASGDFDDDGYTEICTGHAFENNYGWNNGGVIQNYRSPIFVSNDEYNIPNGYNLLLFPNPADNIVTVDLKHSGTGRIKIKIMDLSGKILVTQSFQPENTGFTSTTVNVSSLPAGMYILKMETTSSTLSQKLVISR